MCLSGEIGTMGSAGVPQLLAGNRVMARLTVHVVKGLPSLVDPPFSSTCAHED